MKIFGLNIERRSASAARISDEAGMLAVLGLSGQIENSISVEKALTCPPVECAVRFLSDTMAAVPLHAFEKEDGDSTRLVGKIDTVVNQAFSAEWSSFEARRYFWNQVFTLGRGLLWIERRGVEIVALWPMDAGSVEVRVQAGRKVYIYNRVTYPSSEIVDVCFMLAADMVTARSPIRMGAAAINMSINMTNYASAFFKGGGVPPLSLQGPMPVGAEALARTQADIRNSIQAARDSNSLVFPIPPSFELKPVGIDPDKGQMTEARRFQVEEVARIYGLPPVFLQDLTKSSYSSNEQQDLSLSKHVLTVWAKALEQEMNLKFWGQMNDKFYVEHNLDGIMRGDLASRMTALSTAVNTALLTPNEGRRLENRPPKDGGDNLMIQGATVPIVNAAGSATDV